VCADVSASANAAAALHVNLIVSHADERDIADERRRW